jgi:hypothetical protein
MNDKVFNILILGGGIKENILPIIPILKQIEKATDVSITDCCIHCTMLNNEELHDLVNEKTLSNLKSKIYEIYDINIVFHTAHADFNYIPDMTQFSQNNTSKFDLIMFDIYTEYFTKMSIPILLNIKNMLIPNGMFILSDELFITRFESQIVGKKDKLSKIYHKIKNKIDQFFTDIKTHPACLFSAANLFRPALLIDENKKGKSLYTENAIDLYYYEQNYAKEANQILLQNLNFEVYKIIPKLKYKWINTQSFQLKPAIKRNAVIYINKPILDASLLESDIEVCRKYITDLKDIAYRFYGTKIGGYDIFTIYILFSIRVLIIIIIIFLILLICNKMLCNL